MIHYDGEGNLHGGTMLADLRENEPDRIPIKSAEGVMLIIFAIAAGLAFVAIFVGFFVVLPILLLS